MITLWLRITECSTPTKIRLIEVSGNTYFLAIRNAGAIVFGEPFEPKDFYVEPKYPVWKFWKPKQFIVTHYRLDALRLEVEVEQTFFEWR